MQIFVILTALFSVYAWVSTSLLFFTSPPTWVPVVAIALSSTATTLAVNAGIWTHISISSLAVAVSGLWSFWLFTLN